MDRRAVKKKPAQADEKDVNFKLNLSMLAARLPILEHHDYLEILHQYNN